MQPVAVRNVSIVNCLGVGGAAMVRALRERRSGLVACDFETVDLETWIGRVAGLDDAPVRHDLEAWDCRNNRLAQLGLESDGFCEAVSAAKARHGDSRIGVFLGTSTSGILQTELAYRRRDPHTGALPGDFHYAGTQNTFSLADFVRRSLSLSGPAWVVSSACSSSAKVFGDAARMMEAGVCDAAVVGGVDSLCLTTLHGFRSLGLTSRGPCRPYDVGRDGISIGEGAGFALLERAPAQPARTAPGSGMLLLGVGESSDGFHMSSPHPDGLGARLAMQRALESAGLAPADIDYINLHGTGTRANDASEDKAVSELFGATPCSSTKGSTGHLLGAAGITEAILAMLSIQHGLLPGGLHTQEVDPELRSNYLLQNRDVGLRRVMSNSFGFGGSNCSLVFGAVS